MADKQSGPYKDSDFVKVVNAAGEVQADPVPKAWLDTYLVPAGTKQATKAQVDKADGSDDSES